MRPRKSGSWYYLGYDEETGWPPRTGWYRGARAARVYRRQLEIYTYSVRVRAKLLKTDPGGDLELVRGEWRRVRR